MNEVRSNEQVNIRYNVFYELGHAHALKIPTILMSAKNTIMPFDVSIFRTLFFDLDDLDSLTNMHRNIIQTLTEINIRNEVFISYCHKDSDLFNEFKVFLKPLEKKFFKILGWHKNSSR